MEHRLTARTTTALGVFFATGTMALPGAINHSATQANNTNNTALAFKAGAPHHGNTATDVSADAKDDPDCKLECPWGLGHCKRFPTYYYCDDAGKVRFVLPDLYCSIGCSCKCYS